MSELINKITDYIVQYKFLCIAFVILCIITAFMCVKAGKAVKKNNAERDELIKKLDRMKMIREKYSRISADEIRNDDGENLFEGIVSNIQSKLEKEEDMNSAFDSLDEKKKMIYAANYFFEDGKEKASNFFKNYDKPLSPYAVKAVREIFSDDFADAVKKVYDAYDNDNEEASLIAELVEKDDEAVAVFFENTDFIACATEYIKNHADEFSSETEVTEK